MRKLLVSLLCLLCLFLAFVCVVQQRKITRLENSVRLSVTYQLEQESNEKQAQTTEPVHISSRDVGVPKESHEAVKAHMASVSMSEKRREDQPVEKLFEGLSEMMKSPEMQDAVRAQQQAGIQMMYRDLLAYLELSDDERKSLEQLLFDRQMLSMEEGLKMMRAERSAEERMEMSRALQHKQDSYNVKIRNLLDDEEYAVFEEYERTQPDRFTVNQYSQMLSTDDTLTDNQKHELILVMHETRTNFNYRVDMGRLEKDPSALTDESIELLMEDQRNLQQQYLDNARDLLSDTQYKTYAVSLEQQGKMQEAGLRMAVNMFSRPGDDAK